MRLSNPMPLATSITLAPTLSQIFAISLIKEILVAKKAFEAYLIISAVRISVTNIGTRSGAYNSATRSQASVSLEPKTIRSGCIKSATADPSRRNSGLDTTWNFGIWPSRYFWIMSATQSPVPTGTVDLSTIMMGWSMLSAICMTACST